MKIISQLAVFIVAVFIGCKEKPKNEQQSKPTTVSQAPADIDKIKLTSLDGKPIDLSQYKDKTVFLNFWATWCKPCIEEMPSIANAMKKVNKDEVVFLFASAEEAEEIKAFQQRKPFPFQYVKVENFETLDIMTIPTTFIFNTKGERVFNEMGYRKWDSPENLHIITNSK